MMKGMIGTISPACAMPPSAAKPNSGACWVTTAWPSEEATTSPEPATMHHHAPKRAISGPISRAVNAIATVLMALKAPMKSSWRPMRTR